MYRLTVLYPSKDGEAFDYGYYFDKHHKLVVSRLKPEGMVACEFDKGVSDGGSGRPPYLAIAHLEFNSADELQKRWPSMARKSWATFPNTPKYSR